MLPQGFKQSRGSCVCLEYSSLGNASGCAASPTPASQPQLMRESCLISHRIPQPHHILMVPIGRTTVGVTPEPLACPAFHARSPAVRLPAFAAAHLPACLQLPLNSAAAWQPRVLRSPGSASAHNSQLLFLPSHMWRASSHMLPAALPPGCPCQSSTRAVSSQAVALQSGTHPARVNPTGSLLHPHHLSPPPSPSTCSVQVGCADGISEAEPGEC